MKRIFVAIEIQDVAKRKVSEYIETLRKDFNRLRVGWEKEEKLHLTLKFLGDIDDVQLRSLTEAVRITAEKSSNFKMQITGTGVFPNQRKARVLWVGLYNKKGSLAEMNEILEDSCEKIGFVKGKRKFKPHLTIARLREPWKSRDLVIKHLQNEFEPVEFEVSEIAIIESKLQPTGSVYSVYSKVGLNKSAENQ